jgi:hypothetical protein
LGGGGDDEDVEDDEEGNFSAHGEVIKLLA